MSGRTATPKEITEILAMREAGYSVLHISQKYGFSTRTIHRHLSENNIKKGSLKQDAIDSARNELFKIITSNQSIQEEAAKLITDDIAHSNHIRGIMIEASEYLKATSLTEAVLVMRAAAAYSTTLKNTSDTTRHALGVDKLVDEFEALPELIITELTNEQIKKMAMDSMVEED